MDEDLVRALAALENEWQKLNGVGRRSLLIRLCALFPELGLQPPSEPPPPRPRLVVVDGGRDQERP